MMQSASELKCVGEKPYTILIDAKNAVQCFKNKGEIMFRGVYFGKDNRWHEAEYKYYKLDFAIWEQFCDALKEAEKYMNSE